MDVIAGRDARSMTTIRPVADAEAIRALLRPYGAYAAYPLGQLAPRLFSLVRCWYAEGTRGDGIVLYSSGGLGEAMFTAGDAEAVEAILRLHRGPRHNFATCETDHAEVMRRFYRMAQEQEMSRMLVRLESYRTPPPLRAGLVVRRLYASDARTVNRLYNTEGAPTFYSAGHVEQGYYHGLWEDGRLVAVAGTHVVSPEEGVAVVGNVFTHPRFRGLGYGTAVTAATTRAILSQCSEVTLTVDPANAPAVRAYRRLGYTETGRLIEAPVRRRDIVGLHAAVNRFLAGWRGRADGVELVR